MNQAWSWWHRNHLIQNKRTWAITIENLADYKTKSIQVKQSEVHYGDVHVWLGLAWNAWLLKKKTFPLSKLGRGKLKAHTHITSTYSQPLTKAILNPVKSSASDMSTYDWLFVLVVLLSFHDDTTHTHIKHMHFCEFSLMANDFMWVLTNDVQTHTLAHTHTHM